MAYKHPIGREYTVPLYIPLTYWLFWGGWDSQKPTIFHHSFFGYLTNLFIFSWAAMRTWQLQKSFYSLIFDSLTHPPYAFWRPRVQHRKFGGSQGHHGTCWVPWYVGISWWIIRISGMLPGSQAFNRIVCPHFWGIVFLFKQVACKLFEHEGISEFYSESSR